MPARFIFSMQALLNHRTYVSNRAKREYGDKSKLHRYQEAKLKNKEEALAVPEAEYLAALRFMDETFAAARTSAGNWARPLQSAAAFVAERGNELVQPQQAYDRQKIETEKAKQEMEDARTRALNFYRKQRVIEKLREIRNEEFRAAQELAETAELSEAGSVVHFLNRDDAS
jgi:hypothetical protein